MSFWIFLNSVLKNTSFFLHRSVETWCSIVQITDIHVPPDCRILGFKGFMKFLSSVGLYNCVFCLLKVSLMSIFQDLFVRKKPIKQSEGNMSLSAVNLKNIDEKYPHIYRQPLCQWVNCGPSKLSLSAVTPLNINELIYLPLCYILIIVTAKSWYIYLHYSLPPESRRHALCSAWGNIKDKLMVWSYFMNFLKLLL